MTIGSWARRERLWLVDGPRGAPIRRHCDDIVLKMSSDDDSADQQVTILSHAIQTTRFYSRYSAYDLRALVVECVDRAPREPNGRFKSTICKCVPPASVASA